MITTSPTNGAGLLKRLMNERGESTGPRRPKVGIAGFYGYGNFGDELFLKVFAEHLGDEFDLSIVSDLLEKPYFSMDIKEIVAGLDAIIIGGGDLIQPWATDPRYFDKALLQKPVFVCGVGVPIRSAKYPSQQVEKDFIVQRYLRFLSHPNVKFIHVRDPQSHTWLIDRINPPVGVLEAPDIVCSMTLPAVAPPSTGKPPILGIVTRHRPNRAEPDDYSKVVQLLETALRDGWHVRHIVLGNGRVGIQDVEDAKRISPLEKQLIYTDDLDVMCRAIGQCTCLASMKFHGTVVATMYGVPSIVMIATSKNRNFMRRIGREDLLSSFDSEALIDKFLSKPEPISSSSVEDIKQGALEAMYRLRSALRAELC
jgi:polysaccharide pyruvyl transferase WcaK-like protein